MMPGKAPKAKGNGFERELVNIAKDSKLEAKRAYASNGESLGYHAEVDLVVEGVRIQAKRRKEIAGYVQPTEHVDAVALRQDRGEALIVLRYSDWLDLVASYKPGYYRVTPCSVDESVVKEER